MLAILVGDFSLIVGLVVLLLPLLATELSRPKDAIWGALVLLLGLVLVTTSERFRGAPMLAVLSGTLLIGRLGLEVAQGRWNYLTQEEKERFTTFDRWIKIYKELARVLSAFLGIILEFLGLFVPKSKQDRTVKKWVRPDEVENKGLGEQSKGSQT